MFGFKTKAQFQVAYKKTKRGSVIKVRDYLAPDSAAIPVSKNVRFQRPKHFTPEEIKSIGDIDSKETENQALLLEHDVPCYGFNEEILNCLPKEGPHWKIPQEEFKSRLDIRSLDVCSVDPPGCTDIDDALHYKDIDANTCEVGVHIADVSYFVKADSALDLEASKRGTTVYLCDRRIDMIPDLLSSNLCSLKQDQDRLAFSAFWKMTKNTAEVLEVKFARSIINSKASLTYEKAQEMVDDKSNNGILHRSLRGLNNLAKKLKARRLERGALVLARADEIRFVEVESETCERDYGLEIQHKRMVETNSMVEEFMLLANISVANKLLEVYPEQALLRRHPRPSKDSFRDLVESARVRGFEILVDDGKRLSNSLDRAQLKEDYYFNLMLRMIATRCMTPAAYFCSGSFDPKVLSFNHFGLAAELYTHFTSPIRRYADLLVHRLLASAIGTSILDVNLRNRDSIQMLCNQINYRHRMAQLAGRASSRLHTVLYIDSKQELVEEAHVFSVKQNSIQILIPRIAFDYTYFLRPIYDWRYDVDSKTQKNIRCDVILRQFDKLKVQVSVTKKENVRLSDRIAVKILEPPIDIFDDCIENSWPETHTLGAEIDSDSIMDTSHELVEQVPYKQVKKKIRLGLSETQSSKSVLVVPGDSLDKYMTQDTTILGPGLMRIDEKVVAIKSGILKKRNKNLFWVDYHQKRYVAARGECVIGIVRSKDSQNARVDINSAESAILSLLAFEGSNKKNKPNLKVGDLIYAKVLTASKDVETELVCVNSNGKKDGLGVIGEKGGMMINLSIDTVRVLLSPNCDLLAKLGQIRRYEIALGMNGRVWINSSDASTIIQVANELRKFDNA